MSPSLYELLLGGGMAVLGWLARQMFSEVRALGRELAEHKVVVARDYATNTDIAIINSKLDRILEKVESKADRARYDHHDHP